MSQMVSRSSCHYARAATLSAIAFWFAPAHGADSLTGLPPDIAIVCVANGTPSTPPAKAMCTMECSTPGGTNPAGPMSYGFSKLEFYFSTHEGAPPLVAVHQGGVTQANPPILIDGSTIFLTTGRDTYCYYRGNANISGPQIVIFNGQPVVPPAKP